MSESSLQPGARVGNYVLQELIGAGGFAQVWKAAHHERPGRVVAVKIAVEEDFRRALSREGRMPDIDHPNVVPILDSDTRFAAIPYVVLPYLPGGSLADLIAKHPHGLPEDRVESLLRDILAGLAAAHAQGIVHRDVKPSNVLLDGGGKAMISDFGISLTAAAPGVVRTIVQSGSLNTSGMIAGTLAYMAPEVLEGNAATPASDVYSVGVVLFEMLVGRRPGGLEFPSGRRRDLRAASVWDESYRIACGPADQRHADAKVMGDALRSLGQRAALPPAARGHPEQVLPKPTAALRASRLWNRSWWSLEQVPPKPTAAPASIVVPRGTAEGLPWEAFSPMTPKQAKAVQARAAEHFNLPPTLSLDFGGGVTMELVLIAPGSFIMGFKDGNADEKPPHQVTISKPFFLGKYQVTQSQWLTLMGRDPSHFQGDPDRPVEQVSWEDCQMSCRKLSEKVRRRICLPTEAEWEYACRAGTTTKYGFGDDNGRLGRYAWFNDNSGGKTHPVGRKEPNAWGLYDMHGNVCEWCADWYDRYPGSTAQLDDFGRKYRVLRGGGWLYDPLNCRSANRDLTSPDDRYKYVGFRLAAGTP
jgi:formylglycine-generating enzyme required for sulfatase activity